MEDEEAILAISDHDEDENEDSESEMEDDDGEDGPVQTYLPGEPLEEGEELVCDESAYVMYHQAHTGAPCLSFDVLPDNLGENREAYPLTCYIVAGTQAERGKTNHMVVMKMGNLHRTSKPKAKMEEEKEDEEEESSSESEDEDEKPELETAVVTHSSGCVNRVRATKVKDKMLAATWSDRGKVHIWDLTRPLMAVNDSNVMAEYTRNEESPSPVFTFTGHQVEGFAIDWATTTPDRGKVHIWDLTRPLMAVNDSNVMAEYTRNEESLSPVFTFTGHQVEGFAIDWATTTPGRLATGDCNKNIHVWNLHEGGSWHVDQRPYTGHTSSVEDIQWSPNEANVFSSCSVDRSIRIWDSRAKPSKACMLTACDAHERDINVIHWNRNEPYIVSGGDDGVLKVWDLRQFQHGKSAATFKHHTAPITSVEWHPTDSSIFIASGSDDQISIWDLAVEKDSEPSSSGDAEPEVPAQLLFIHQGQTDIKEIHWHRQLPGVILSTAHSGFNIFRTISV